MPKKIAALLLALLLLLQIPNAVQAQPTIRISVDGQQLALSQPPVAINGTTMVPLAPIFKKLGLTLEFDAVNRYVKGRKQGLAIRLKPGSSIADVNGVTVIMSQPVQVIKGTTMVPLRFVSDSLGASVATAGANAISITSGAGSTLFENNLPLFISGNYVRNTAGKDILAVDIVDFFYNPTSKQVKEFDYDSHIIGLDAGSTAKYNDYEALSTVQDERIYIGSAIREVEHYESAPVKNKNYDKIKAYYLSKAYLDQVRAVLKARDDAFKADLKKELQANRNKPLKVTQATVSYNSIGVPEVNLTIKNLTAKTVIAYEMSVSCYDDFGRRVNRWLSASNVFEGISQGNHLVSGDYQTDTWTMNLYDLATQVKNVKITAVKFSDGTSWKP